MAALRGLTFEQFVAFQFDHAVGAHPWQMGIDADWWEPEPRTGVAYLTRLFSEGASVLEWYHDDQIAQGLTGLVNTMAIGDQPWMRDPITPVEERAAVWGAIAAFFRNTLEPRCARVLGHNAAEAGPAINGVAYMWWDSFPGFANADDPERQVVDDAELVCLERILALDSPACQESALHGLGHWVGREPRCAQVIDRYLASGKAAMPELAGYAEAARSGCIL